NPVLCRQIEGFDAPPPRIEIVDHELHHVILGEVGNVVFLDEKAERSQFRNRQTRVDGTNRKAQVCIETHAGLEILRRHKRTQRHDIRLESGIAHCPSPCFHAEYIRKTKDPCSSLVKIGRMSGAPRPDCRTWDTTNLNSW